MGKVYMSDSSTSKCEVNISKIEALTNELNDMKEDERNTQNQIFQIVSIVGTVLGILFGTSFLGPNERNSAILIFRNTDEIRFTWLKYLFELVNSNVTYSRISFWLGALVFCTAFAYITVLGINNILRYYYIQDLQDRLHELETYTKDDDGRGRFLHWSEFSAPIITRNPKHITSSHTILYFFSYTIAVASIVLFSVGMVFALFYQIDPRKDIDSYILAILVIYMCISFVLFIRFSINAKGVAQFAWNTAHDNQKIRMGNDQSLLYKRSKYFSRFLKYLIYPKIQDLQKPLLIAIGGIYGLITNHIKFDYIYIFRLIFSFIIFDFLAYQARYQINDIRGIKEDKEAGSKNRLLSDDVDNPSHVIELSFFTAILKFGVAVLATIIWGNEKRCLILSCLGLLLLSTVIYETVRKIQNTKLIFWAVGMGYPLRFMLGYYTVVPVSFTLSKELLQSILLVCTLWAYGSFSSILSWTAQVSARMQKEKKEKKRLPISYEKKHFKYLQDLIIDRFRLAEKHPVNDNILPLREKCSFSDPWNIVFLLCLVFIMSIVVCEKVPLVLLLLEVVVCLFFIVANLLYDRNKVVLMGIGWCVIIIKILLGIVLIDKPVNYLMISLLQLIITVTYFVLYYQPQIKTISFKELLKSIINILIVKLLGEYAANMMKKKSN